MTVSGVPKLAFCCACAMPGPSAAAPAVPAKSARRDSACRRTVVCVIGSPPSPSFDQLWLGRSRGATAGPGAMQPCGGGRPWRRFRGAGSARSAWYTSLERSKKGVAMAYDLLIKNGRIVDGSGMPGFRGDVGVKGGRKITEIGKLSGPAKRTIDAEGRVVAPGFVDNHCHYDAQVTWDPLCTFSPDHGCTTVVFGNCSLALAPVRPGSEKRVAEFLSYVEAIPMEVLNTVEVDWETIPQYMDRLDQNLGVNVGNLIGHSTVRYYVMGDDSQKRAATDDEIKKMQDIVRDGVKGGALGLSVSRNKGHYDPQGVHIPALWADEKEIFALGDVLREMGTGIIQSGGGRAAELKDGLMARLSEATGRTVIYKQLGPTGGEPDAGEKNMARGEETSRAGIRAYPLCSPNRTTQSFTMRNCQTFRGSPTWHPILLSSDDEKLRAYADPAIRQKLHDEVVEHTVEVPAAGYSREGYK